MRARKWVWGMAFVLVGLFASASGAGAQSSPAPARSIPSAERDVVLLATGGVVLLLAGGVLMAVARRRSPTSGEGVRGRSQESPLVDRLRRDVSEWTERDN